MSNLDWNNPDYRNEDYWRELYKMYVERANIVKNYSPHLGTSYWGANTYFQYKFLDPNTNEFKRWTLKLFKNIDIILDCGYWVDPNLIYRIPKMNYKDEWVQACRVPNTNTTSLTPYETQQIFPGVIQTAHCPYSKDNDQNKMLKFYHDELSKRRYTLAPFNYYNFPNQVQGLTVLANYEEKVYGDDHRGITDVGRDIITRGKQRIETNFKNNEKKLFDAVVEPTEWEVETYLDGNGFYETEGGGGGAMNRLFYESTFKSVLC